MLKGFLFLLSNFSDSVMHTRRYESLTLNVSVNIGLIKDITKLIKEAFPKARLIPTIGNHDFFPNAQTSTAMYADFETIWSEEIQPHNDTFKAGKKTFTFRRFCFKLFSLWPHWDIGNYEGRSINKLGRIHSEVDNVLNSDIVVSKFEL